MNCKPDVVFIKIGHKLIVDCEIRVHLDDFEADYIEIGRIVLQRKNKIQDYCFYSVTAFVHGILLGYDEVSK